MDNNQSKPAVDPSAPSATTPPVQPPVEQVLPQSSVPVSGESPAPVAQTESPAGSPPAQPSVDSASASAPSTATTDPSTPSTPSAATPPLSENKNSSKKTILIVVLILLVALPVLGWVAYQNMSKNSGTIYQGAYKEKKVTPTSVPTPTVGTVKSGDAKLDQQSTEIDTSMSLLNADISNIDKELQD